MKKVRWLIDGEVPVETNITVFKVVSGLVIFTLVVIAIALAMKADTLWKAGVMIAFFLIAGVFAVILIWDVCTNFSQDFFDELHS